MVTFSRMQRASRLKRELQMLSTEPPPGITAWQTEDRVDDLRARRLTLLSVTRCEDTSFMLWLCQTHDNSREIKPVFTKAMVFNCCLVLVQLNGHCGDLRSAIWVIAELFGFIVVGLSPIYFSEDGPNNTSAMQCSPISPEIIQT